MKHNLSPVGALTAFVVASVLLILPLLFAEYPPIHDYPYHIARVHVLMNLDRIPEFQTWYVAGSLLLPNVGMDVVTLVLAQVMPVEVAGRVFLGLTAIVTLGGAVALHRALFGAFSWWPFVSAFFVYNWVLLFGFLGYLLGVGLLLWAAAIWIWLGSANIWLRVIAGTVIAVVMYQCHMLTFGLYALFVFGYEVQRNVVRLSRDWTGALANLLAAGVPFAIPLVHYVSSRIRTETGGLMYADDWLFRKAANFRALMFGDWALDISLAVAVIAVAAVIWRFGRFRIDRRVVLAIALIIAAYVAMPTGLATAWYVDTRLTIAIAFLLIAVTQVEIDRTRVQTLVIVALALFLGFRTLWLSTHWHSYDKVNRDVVAAFDTVQKNGIIFVVSAAPVAQISDIDLRLWQPPMKFLASYAVLAKPVFVPTTFADQRSQPLGIKDGFERLYDVHDRKPLVIASRAELDELRDELLELTEQTGTPDAPVYALLLYPERLSEDGADLSGHIARGTSFELLKISPGD